jgi:hypothetical protein
MPRDFQIAQFPNPPMILSLAARVVARTEHGSIGHGAQVVSDLALLVWAYEEVTDGANWVRRLFGVGGGAYAIRSLIRGV